MRTRSGYGCSLPQLDRFFVKAQLLCINRVADGEKSWYAKETGTNHTDSRTCLRHVEHVSAECAIRGIPRQLPVALWAAYGAYSSHIISPFGASLAYHPQ